MKDEQPKIRFDLMNLHVSSYANVLHTQVSNVGENKNKCFTVLDPGLPFLPTVCHQLVVICSLQYEKTISWNIVLDWKLLTIVGKKK